MTLNDFIMESAIVETTNDTAVSDIQMEQYNAEINVGMAMLNCMEKYAMLSEYATCDINEFFEEGKLDDKIANVDEWKNSGGKVKKVLGTIGAGILKGLRAIANFFKNLFSKDKNPFARAKRLIQKMKFNSKKSLRAQLAEAREDIKEEMKENKELTDKYNKTKKERDYYEKENWKNQRAAQDNIGKVMDLTAKLETIESKHGDLVAQVKKLSTALKEAESDNAKFVKTIQDLYEEYQEETIELREKLDESNKKLDMTVADSEAKLTKWEAKSVELTKQVEDTIADVDAYFAKVDEGKISVDKRTKSYKSIKGLYAMLLELKARLSKV